MGDSGLTPEEYEMDLRDLRDRLLAFLERGEGRLGQLKADAEKVLVLAQDFPDVYERYRDVEGMVAEMLARAEQRRYMGTDSRKEAPGCLLGWLFKGRKG